MRLLRSSFFVFCVEGGAPLESHLGPWIYFDWPALFFSGSLADAIFGGPRVFVTYWVSLELGLVVFAVDGGLHWREGSIHVLITVYFSFQVFQIYLGLCQSIRDLPFFLIRRLCCS